MPESFPAPHTVLKGTCTPVPTLSLLALAPPKTLTVACYSSNKGMILLGAEVVPPCPLSSGLGTREKRVVTAPLPVGDNTFFSPFGLLYNKIL